MTTEIKRNIFVNVTAHGDNPIVVTVSDMTQIHSLSFVMSVDHCRDFIDTLQKAIKMVENGERTG